jgi:hypothetical protein
MDEIEGKCATTTNSPSLSRERQFGDCQLHVEKQTRVVKVVATNGFEESCYLEAFWICIGTVQSA